MMIWKHWISFPFHVENKSFVYLAYNKNRLSIGIDMNMQMTA